MSTTTPIQKLPSHLLSFEVSPWLTIGDLARSSSVSRDWRHMFSRNETLQHYFQRNALPVIKAFSESLRLHHGKEFEAQVEVLDESNKAVTLKSVGDALNQPAFPLTTIKSLHDTLCSIKRMFCGLFAQLKPEAYETIQKSVSLPSQFSGLFNSTAIPRAWDKLSQDNSEENFRNLFLALALCKSKDDVEVGFKTYIDLHAKQPFISDLLWRINGVLIELGFHQVALEFCNWLPSSSDPEEDLQGLALKETITNFPPIGGEDSTNERKKIEKKCLEDSLAAAKKITSKNNREEVLQGLYLMSMDTPETDLLREAIEWEFRKSKGSSLPTESIFQGWLSCGNFEKALSIANQSPNKEKMKDLIFSAREERVNRQLLNFYRSHNWVRNTEKNSSGQWVETWTPPPSQLKNSLKWDASSSELIAGSKKGYLGTRKSSKAEDVPAISSASTSALNLRKRKEPAN